MDNNQGDWGILYGRSRTFCQRNLIVTALAIINVGPLWFIINRFQNSGLEPEEPKICLHPICLKQTAKITEMLDLSIRPCDNFYNFVCNNFLKAVDKDEKLELKKLQKRQLLELYEEQIQEGEHRMLKATKMLFQTCLDEIHIAHKQIEFINGIFQAIGGWPLFEGSKWRTIYFNWLRAIYKLRELGYPYESFFKISVVANPYDNDKYKFQVAPVIPDFNQVDILTLEDTIRGLGATDEQRIEKEIKETYAFWENLKTFQLAHSSTAKTTYSILTLENFTRQFDGFDWLDYFNKIIGPRIQISKKHSILAPPAQNLTKLINFIANTPKRVQANYIIWTVLDKLYSLLNRRIRYVDPSNPKYPSRTEYCLKQTEKRFDPSPVLLAAYKKYLPLDSMKRVKEFITQIKSEFIEFIINSDWISLEDKALTANKAYKLKVVVGLPECFYEDKILDYLEIDMISVNDETFLNLIAQATRNHESATYKEVYSSSFESLVDKNYMDNHEIVLLHDRNILFVPLIVVQRFYNENLPQYLNYGALGTVIINRLTDLLDPIADKFWSNKTKEVFEENIKCMRKELSEYNTNFIQKAIPYLESTNIVIAKSYLKKIMGNRIIHYLYTKWQSAFGDEQLVSLNYTSNQLFWISAGTTMCPRGNKPNLKEEIDEMYLILSKNDEFIKDFNCPEGSNISPARECKIF